MALYAISLVLLGLALHLFRNFFLLLWRQFCSPLRLLPGPPSPSFFMGNLEEMHDMENNNLIERWVKSYGNTFVYRGFIGGCRLITTDPVAVAHILGNAYDYPKPDFVRDSLASMAAGHQGLLTVEGEDHRRQASLTIYLLHLSKRLMDVLKRKILVNDFRLFLSASHVYPGMPF